MKHLFLCACGLFDGDASEFSEGNTKLVSGAVLYPRGRKEIVVVSSVMGRGILSLTLFGNVSSWW